MPKSKVNESSSPPKIQPIKVAAKKPRKVFKFRFLNETNLHNVRRDQIFYYILSLHKKIRSLLRKCKRYREKIIKLDRVSRKNSTTSEKNSSERKTETKDTEATGKESEATNFIAEIKNAAHQAQNETGFIYEPTSGLYYDSRTGYYYNAEHGLYYDGNNGCYYSYNQAENKFEFHSQVYSSEDMAAAKDEKTDNQNDRENAKRKRLKSTDSDHQANPSSSSSSSARAKAKKLSKTPNSEQKEDGEISDENDDSADDEDYRVRSDSPVYQRKQIVYDIDDDSYTSSGSGQNSPYNTFSDIAKQYPPSLRIIVQETNIRKLKIGELFLITYKGGSLGREGKHDVIIPDINCSKYHLKFVYDESENGYTCTDLGSRNGTFMNGKRMSNAKQESEPMQLVHGALLQIGQTKLLCHIHDGHSTCGQCEPGLLTDSTASASAYSETVEASTTAAKSKPGNVNDDHKRQLKNLKKRYGLQDEKYVAPKMDAKTTDRAEKRRQAVGSSCEHEKTKAASLNASISSENKGFKMLSKLGWSEGQTLGKNNDGLLEPIPLKMNEKNKGLGCESSVSVSSLQDPKQKHKARIWEKTHQRYHASSERTVDIFKDCSDESD
ncbi:angiogenic factor with G patch and FHA domains 1 isoform X1 [Sitodiplosis mosellana]|uniref:angiogenic factor with G patch and FHA domains 1 isoform X1 n=1 Tax=Sitodiplosis mosellana TaxID=263140 RepID=UPI0024452F78|nr:angiogenic factor with G patch and FHA domains 1 isoform X1 [Sitodiplosis mosellana]